ncbi:MAG: Rrf2 family transcriptional regulator [Deltaproteobacteria bacterium]|nr:Rrf2 family transcriptional regulator [Deltaproteobacteria bacterium]
MLQITREGEYAFRAVLYLASRPVGLLSRVSEIAEAAEIPSSYLSKIMRRLCAAGLVKSYRGPKGGFVLARPAESITLREAIEAVEGPISSNPRLVAKGGRGPGKGFALHPVWEEAQRSFLDVLGARTIADISKDGEAIRDRAGLKKVGP